MTEVKAFQIDASDNVVTLLSAAKEKETVRLTGNLSEGTASLTALQDVPSGHKLALSDIAENEDIIKYGVVIGRAICPIQKGSWVHLHNIKSVYDERSSHLDVVTGAPKDTRYE